MSSVPEGYSSIGPVYMTTRMKEKFVDACKLDGKTINTKLKEIVLATIREKFPDFNEGVAQHGMQAGGAPLP